MQVVIIEYTFVTLTVLTMSIGLIWKIVKNKSVMPTEEEDKKNKVDPRVIIWRNKHKKIIGTIFMVPMCTILIMGMYFIVIPFLKDFRYIVTQDYSEFSGEVISEVIEIRRARESVVISNGSKKIEVRVETHGEKKGDYVNVKYLPNSKVGAFYKAKQGEE